MDNNLPIQIAFGWSTSRFRLICMAIRYLTRKGINPFRQWARWSHMFLIFRFADGTEVIHEALMSSGWRQQPARRLVDWKKKDPKNNTYTVKWLPIDVPEVEDIYKESIRWVGTRSYAVRQLIAFGVTASVLGRKLKLALTSGDEEVFCSEGACQLVGEKCPEWDLRQYPNECWDSISPQAAYDSWKWRIARSETFVSAEINT